jgi:hypothetical protein
MEISCLQSLAILAQPQLHPLHRWHFAVKNLGCSSQNLRQVEAVTSPTTKPQLFLADQTVLPLFCCNIIEVTNKILLSCSSEYNVFLTPKLAHLRIFPGIEMWLHISTAPSVSLAKQGHYVHAARLRSQNRHAALLRSLLFFCRCHYSVMQSGSFQDLKL